MKMKRLNIQFPPALKAKLDGMRSEGFTVAGYLRRLVESDLQAREDAGWVAGKGWPRRGGRRRQ